MGRIIEVNIEKIIAGGRGMGHHGGKVVFSELCAAGDTVKLRVIKEKKSYIVGEVVDIVEPSPDRIEPECEYFGSCGGCRFWHVDYETELSYKKSWSAETMQKIGKVEAADIVIHASPSSEHYRNRVQFKVKSIDGAVLLGFYKRGTNRVVDIDKCLIVSERINAQIKPVKDMVRALSFSDRIPQVDITIDDEGRAVTMIIHVIADGQVAAERELKELFHKYFDADVKPFLQSGRKSTLRPLFDSDSDIKVTYTLRNSDDDFTYPIMLSPGSFLQVNYSQNIKLVDILLEYLEISDDESILDLFCGAGNFSFAASAFCRYVTGVESYEPAVTDAVENMEQLNINNAKFICANVTDEVNRLSGSGEVFDSVIVDPPREGAILALKNIDKIVKNKIVYISCDVATFSRDAAFLRSLGFEIDRISLVDMFPRTHHVEAIALFTSSR